MNCAECREILVGYVEGLLDVTEQEAVQLHLSACPPCRDELEQVTVLRDRLTANGRTLVRGDFENAVIGRIAGERNLRLKQIEKHESQFNLWRMIMKNRMAKLAAAAVIIGVLAGLHFFGGPHVASVAWGELADRVGRIQTYIYRGYTKTIIDANTDNSKVTELEVEVFVS